MARRSGREQRPPTSARLRPGLPVRSGLQAGSVVGRVTDTARAVVAAIPPKLLSFEA